MFSESRSAENKSFNFWSLAKTAVMDFPSERELREWLAQEPYITGDVWRRVEVMKCNVKNLWKFNRPQEFFEERRASQIKI